MTNPWNDKKQVALKSAWYAYRTWAKTSRITAQRIRRSRTLVLVLTIAGSVLSTASQLVGANNAPGSPVPYGLSIAHRVLASGGALALAFGAYLTHELLKGESQRKWLRARAVAEGAESESFLFRLGIGPYDTADAAERLIENLASQRDLAAGINHELITEQESVERLPSGPLTCDDYLQFRVIDQIKWYEQSVKDHARYLQWAQLVTLFLGIVSVALSLIAVKDLGIALIPLAATLTAVLSSHISSAQYSYLVTSYQSTADRLRSLIQEWELSDRRDDSAFQAWFSRTCESVMASENSAWMVRLSEKVHQPQIPLSNELPARADGTTAATQTHS